MAMQGSLWCGINEIYNYRLLGHEIERLGFKTIHNNKWANSNMVASIKLALDQIEGPLIFSYSDIVFILILWKNFI